MELVHKYLSETWSMTTLLAPWLLLGFALAGVISIYISRTLVVRLLGKPGIGSIFKATLIGVPMPLCSCGVIPVAAAIREKGAGKGATAAFLASTPETGVDSFVATWGMLGPLMALVRVAVAFVTGMLAGLFVQFATRGEKEAASPAAVARDEGCEEPRKSFLDALKYAFLTMPRDMAPSLLTGVLLAGAVSAFVPGDFFASTGMSGFAAYLVVTLVAVPLYVCSTGSIPLALAMIGAGFSPGCALVFLLAGPATNVATIVTMRRYLGTRAIAAYLLAIVITAWSAGAIVDAGLGRETILGQMPHHMSHVSATGIVCAIILAALVLRGLFARLFPRGEKAACSCESEKRAEKTCCCHGGENKHAARGDDDAKHDCCRGNS